MTNDAHWVDQHLANRVRERRKALGVSQKTLANSLGITFQQIHKYEKGKNRIAASTLYDIARILDTPVWYFFDGLVTAPPELSPG